MIATDMVAAKYLSGMMPQSKAVRNESTRNDRIYLINNL